MSDFAQWAIAILVSVGFALLIYGAYLIVEDKERAHQERLNKRK
jgi:threonine/homoserine/homoserine lactone efflux protein